ncbi:thioesterase II family protein [Micromonospora sp. CA-248089]|uniref:thioesterase II family protein n=1 Tax=Micromonospora sp. CA-248089 TaxID=3239960 RepID=UPI003D8D586B
MSDHPCLWWLRRSATPADAVLVLLPPAGGSAQTFAGWDLHLPGRLGIAAVQYPGRASRRAEPPAGSVGALAGEVFEALAGHAGPVHLFGHSLGALVGFELSWRLQTERRAPATVIASAAVPPHRRAALGDRLADAAAGDLAMVLTDARTLSPAAARRPQVLHRRAPIYRADFAAAHAYEYGPAVRRLRTPLVAVGGRQDPLVPGAELARWRELTEAPRGVHTLPGGHFYYLDNMAALAALIADAVR